jgi:CheY-like chemotaxis protein
MGCSVVMSKILLAEDDTDMRRFLVKALQNAGFDVTSYDNGLSAYHRLREEPFELLLTDIVMPEMDGIELARRAAELRYQDHVHHGFRRRGAQSGFQRTKAGQSPVEAGAPA